MAPSLREIPMPLGQLEKALGHEPQIDPWLTPYNRRACSVSKPIGVVATKEDVNGMEQPKSTARHDTRPASPMARGLDGANYTRASGGRRKMFLTSPYIEQAI